MFEGELISIGVSVSWTVTAVCMEYASLHVGSLQTNFLRLLLAMVLTGVLLQVTTGFFFPLYLPLEGWLWMGISGFIGYVLGDICLYQSYVVMGARFGQLFMTLSPIAAAFTAALFLGESMDVLAIAGMVLTISGVAMSIFSREKKKMKIPFVGVLLGLGAAAGQGIGMVCSKYGIGLCYQASPEPVRDMIPFAAGQIRMIVGTASFFIVIAATGKMKTLKPGITDGKAAASIFGGTVFGPFLGVSLSLLALNLTGSGIAATLTSLAPLMIIPYSAWVRKERVTATEIIGACISITGVSLFFL